MWRDAIEALFQPIAVGGITLPTRFVMPGMNRGWYDGGVPAERYGPYYAERVRHGAGLVITGACPVDHPSASAMTDPPINAKSAVGWSKAAEAVRAAGGHLFQQLWHEGAIRVAEKGFYPDAPTLSPSGLACAGRPNGRAATLDELDDIIAAFADAAVCARDAGFSGVEIHGAHGFLIDQFLWADTNLRDDRYGGDTLAERSAFPLAIVQAVRGAVGPDFPISFRFSQWKEVAFEARIMDPATEMAGFVAALEEAGVDMLHASDRYFWKPDNDVAPLNLAGWARRFAKVPVITVGSVGLKIDLFGGFLSDQATFEAAGADQLQQLARMHGEGQFDLVAVGRSLIGDAAYLEKLRNGDLAAIRRFTKADVMGDYEYDPGIVGEVQGMNAELMRKGT